MLRGGDVVGEHSVIFYGESERVKFHIEQQIELFLHAGLFVRHDLLLPPILDFTI